MDCSVMFATIRPMKLGPWKLTGLGLEKVCLQLVQWPTGQITSSAVVLKSGAPTGTCPQPSAVLVAHPWLCCRLEHDSNIVPKRDDATSLGLIKDNNETEETTEMIMDCTDCTRQRGTHHASTSLHRYFYLLLIFILILLVWSGLDLLVHI